MKCFWDLNFYDIIAAKAYTSVLAGSKNNMFDDKVNDFYIILDSLG